MKANTIGGLRSNGTETYDNGINILYLKCFLLGADAQWNENLR